MTKQDTEQTTYHDFWPKTAFNWLELALKVVLVFASIGAVYQYFDVKQENRIKQTMEQLRNFNSDKLLDAQLRLNKIWEKRQDFIEELNQETVSSENDKKEVQAKFVLSIIEYEKVQQKIRLLVDFFENLQVCMQHRICDVQVTQDLFCGNANNLYEVYRPWIEKERIVIPGYANQLQILSTRCRENRHYQD